MTNIEKCLDQMRKWMERYPDATFSVAPLYRESMGPANLLLYKRPIGPQPREESDAGKDAR